MINTSAYCKKHDEIEPQDNAGMWVCPVCSKENMEKLFKTLPCGRKPMDVAVERILKRYGDVPFKTVKYIEKQLGKKLGNLPDIDLD